MKRRAWSWLLGVALCLACGCGWTQPAVQLIDRAQVSIHSPGLPDARREMALPLHWDALLSGRSGTLDLHMPFRVPQPNTQPWAILVPRMGNAWRMELNGQLLQEEGELGVFDDHWAAKRPVWVPLPTSLLRADNTLRITLRADLGRRAGIAAVRIGPSRALRPAWTPLEWLHVTAPQSAAVLSFLVAAFCMLLWWQQRDRLYAVAAVGELAWGLRLLDIWWENSPFTWPVWLIGLLGLFTVWSLASYFLMREVWGGRPRWEQRGAVLLIACGVVAYWISVQGPATRYLVHATTWSLAVWLLLEARLAWEALRRPSWPRWLMVLSLTGSTVALLRDVYAARSASHLFDEPAWSWFSAIVGALSVLLIVSMRFKNTREDLVRLNQSIQARITDRERQLHVQHTRLTALESEKAAAAERTRILRDMHDGAGAHLITAIRQIESGRASHAELLQILGESLDQLRLSVDAMHLPPGDVNSLLASLRFRLEKRIQAAGMRLLWDADELPHLPHCTSTCMRHIQFIAMEAISNAIQHAQADRLTLTARATPHAVVIELSDNGTGLGGHPGNGLRGMQERAALIGAQIDWSSQASGCTVRLSLPLKNA